MDSEEFFIRHIKTRANPVTVLDAADELKTRRRF
jgi:hypothetical protein